MGWLDPTHLMVVLVAISVVAALWLHIASAIKEARRKRSRRFFALGFSVGWTAATLFGRRNQPKSLRTLMMKRARPLGLARSSR